jgi:hypothetical protein
MNHLASGVLVALFFSFSQAAFSANTSHRNYVVKGALLSSMNQQPLGTVWPSYLSLGSAARRYFYDVSDQAIAPRPRLVRSGYDEAISYDLSDMYSYQKPRAALILNFAITAPGTVYSIGFDSGVRTKKLSIKPSLFLGFAQAYAFSNRQHVAISVGHWFGGSISESPCIDAYDRQYWCPNLTAWEDYEPEYPEQNRFIDIAYVYRF